MVIGHPSVEARLKRSLPPVSLLVGPESVGKTTLAFEAIRSHGFRDDDVYRFKKLTVSSAKLISESSIQAPRGLMKVYVVFLDGASVNSMNVLLKALEEAPVTTRFILICTELPSQTITSRAEVFRFALLSVSDVEHILLAKGINPTVSKNAAMASSGQVRNALRCVNGATDAKMGVLAVIGALMSRDEETLNAQASRWTDDHTHLLTTLGYELITKQWRSFDPAEVEGVSSKLALRILEAVRPRIRGRLTVNASLMNILKGDA